MKPDAELRVTRGTKITEDHGEFLGLPGGLIFAVMIAFALFQNIFHFFPVSVAGSVLVFFVLRYFFRDRPAHFFAFWLWERAAPKVFRPRMDRHEY